MKVVVLFLFSLVLMHGIHAAAEFGPPPSYDAVRPEPSPVELDAVQKALGQGGKFSIERYSLTLVHELRNRKVSSERLLFLNEVFKWESANEIKELRERATRLEGEAEYLRLNWGSTERKRTKIEEQYQASNNRVSELESLLAESLEATERACSERNDYQRYFNEEQRKCEFLVAGIGIGATLFLGYHAFCYAVKVFRDLKMPFI